MRILFLIVSLLLTGCSGTVAGYAKAVPPAGTPVAVISNGSAYAQTATQATRMWLQERGLNVMERAQLQRLLDERQLGLMYGADQEADRAKLALLSAAQLVVVETPLFRASASIRGISVDSGEVVWTAAYAAGGDFPSDSDVTVMTRAALEQAWARRPASMPADQRTQRQDKLWQELDRESRLRESWCSLGAIAQQKDPALYADLCRVH